MPVLPFCALVNGVFANHDIDLSLKKHSERNRKIRTAKIAARST
jgi:hypothetical protein